MNEQTQAASALTARGIYHQDRGYGFFVYGRFGRWMSPAEVLRELSY